MTADTFSSGFIFVKEEHHTSWTFEMQCLLVVEESFDVVEGVVPVPPPTAAILKRLAPKQSSHADQDVYPCRSWKRDLNAIEHQFDDQQNVELDLVKCLSSLCL
jgi:hypothetical protein